MNEIKTNEIKELMERMEVATARGRAEINGRAISLEPDKNESSYQARTRADLYVCTAKELANGVGLNRAGMSADELESVEFIREQLIDLAKNVCVKMIEQEAKS